jgi:hypothetical protein
MGLSDLFKPPHKSSNPERRLKAVAKLTDQSVLAELAKTDPSPRVRKAAVERIDDQDMLMAVALDGDEIDARLAAVERIGSQEKLAEIIKVRRNYRLMAACFSQITDKAILEKIAYDTEYNMSARRMAIEGYAEESFLADLQPPTSGEQVKTPEEIDALIEKYGGARLARALGKFRGSPSAMTALGQIMNRGGEDGKTAVDYLAQGLIHANAEVRAVAERQVMGLRDPDLIMHLFRQTDNPALTESIMAVLKKIDHPAARRIIEEAGE